MTGIHHSPPEKPAQKRNRIALATKRRFHLLLSSSSGQKARRALTLQLWGGIINYGNQVRLVSGFKKRHLV